MLLPRHSRVVPIGQDGNSITLRQGSVSSTGAPQNLRPLGFEGGNLVSVIGEVSENLSPFFFPFLSIPSSIRKRSAREGRKRMGMGNH
jgi:hypothetical protein